MAELRGLNRTKLKDIEEIDIPDSRERYLTINSLNKFKDLIEQAREYKAKDNIELICKLYIVHQSIGEVKDILKEMGKRTTKGEHYTEGDIIAIILDDYDIENNRSGTLLITTVAWGVYFFNENTKGYDISDRLNNSDINMGMRELNFG